MKRKRQQINIRVDPDDKRALLDKARANHMGLSEYLVRSGLNLLPGSQPARQEIPAKLDKQPISGKPAVPVYLRTSVLDKSGPEIHKPVLPPNPFLKKQASPATQFDEDGIEFDRLPGKQDSGPPGKPTQNPE